jgi:prephenate dehydratase
MRVAYLGPAGTFSEEALRAIPLGRDPATEAVPTPTIYAAVLAVHEGSAERAIVPIENALEGSVTITLDTLALEHRDVVIVGESVLPVSQCLIAREPIPLDEIRTVLSHPHASAQCVQFLRSRLPDAEVLAARSTAEAVQRVAAGGEGLAALGSRHSAELYGCAVLRAQVEDVAGNETRFALLAPRGTTAEGPGPWKTSVVFWGIGAESPGWLVGCLSEFAFRGVNLTRIESRPRKQGLGRYMFFVDLEGRRDDDDVAGALEAVVGKTDELLLLGSYPAA